MEVETTETDSGTEIHVKTDRKAVVVVRDAEGERIYLPEVENSDSSYYVEEVESLLKVDNGYLLLHPREVRELEVIN